MATDSRRNLIAEERKSRNLTSDNLFKDNNNIQNLLSSFNIEEKLPIALSEEKVSITEESFLC